MAKLRMPREQVENLLVERIRTGEDLAVKVEVAERTGGYRDWLHLFATWRNDTITQLKGAYEEKDIALEFEVSRRLRSARPRNSRSNIGRLQFVRGLGDSRI